MALVLGADENDKVLFLGEKEEVIGFVKIKRARPGAPNEFELVIDLPKEISILREKVHLKNQRKKDGK